MQEDAFPAKQIGSAAEWVGAEGGSRLQDDAGCSQHQCCAVARREQSRISSLPTKVTWEIGIFPKWESNAVLCCRRQLGPSGLRAEVMAGGRSEQRGGETTG